MEHTRLHILVQLYLNNSLDHAAQQEFYSLLADPAQKEALAEKFLELTGAPDMHLEFDPTLLPVLHNILQADVPPVTKVKRLFNWKYAAAAAILLLIGGTAVYKTLQQPKQTIQTAHNVADVAPGQQGAILTLADGSTVMLDSAGNRQIASQGGTKVSINNGQVAYDATTSASETIAYNTTTTPKGRQFRIVLPDGTKVWLNAASSVRYPVAFSGNKREVEISGEAYFEVAQDAAKPFSVKFSKGTVEVLGTAFNINAYADEPVVKTTLLEGSVRVNKKQILKPGEQARMDNNNSLEVVTDIDTNDEVAWKNGLFVMSSTNFPALLRQISRWYDIEVALEGELPQRSFGGKIGRNVSLASITQALTIYGVNCKLEKGKLIVRP